MDEGELANLAVAASDRGQGVGAALLDAMLDDASARGTLQVYLEVRESNAAARRLYASKGFEEIGRRKQYYRSPTEDALILRRTLEPGIK
jgi:ribosomal-protein-alanine N-acetyltransferase